VSAPSVADALAILPFTRLIHFTPASNLWGIFTDGMIRTAEDLAANADSYSPTDTSRVDDRRSHTCCSFEYPNLYYLRKAKARTALLNYPDWVGLILNRGLVARPGTLFAGCNAARASGAHLAEGGQALLDCWSDPSIPEGYRRSLTHHAGVPTDLQTEVLIPGSIDLAEVTAIVAPTAAQVQTLVGFLSSVGLNPERVQWRYSPALFDIRVLPSSIQNGREIPETIWGAPKDPI
jgi:ssDNA thymidine ADP-ribosyltransferase, DarT